jgi:membrane fusion protein
MMADSVLKTNSHSPANQGTLFTEKALVFRREKSQGHPRLMGPPKLGVLVLLLLLTLIAAIGFLLRNDYARKAKVPGYLEYSETTKRLYPERGGRVEQLFVDVGDHVSAGQRLALVSSGLPRQIEHGTDVVGEYSALIAHQHRSRKVFLANGDLRQQTYQADRQSMQTAIGLQQEMLQYQEQKQQQTQKIYQAGTTLFAKGQLSLLGFNELEERWYTTCQATTDQRATLASLTARQQQVQLKIDHHDLSLRAGLLPIDAEIMRLEQGRNHHLREMRQEITAPINGTVATLLLEPGEQVAPAMPLLTLVPDHVILQARLLIASHAIGFVQVGQRVSLLFDAFPYQQFGSYPGTVVEVSPHPLTRHEKNTLPDGSPPVYLAAVALDSVNISAYGKPIALREGMTLSADIMLESRSLIDWLLEPLLVMRGRGSNDAS